MSQAGGQRYAWVGICAGLGLHQRIAMVAHELRHALEIAEAAHVVDVRSLAAFYRHTGLRQGVCRDECYETEAALQTERQVGHDLQRRARFDTQD